MLGMTKTYPDDLLLVNGNGLGPVHSSTGPVEMLPRIQKLYKTGHVAKFQRVQCSCALDPSLIPCE